MYPPADFESYKYRYTLNLTLMEFKAVFGDLTDTIN